MNNRPLFWAVMCFALGEVTYIIAGRGDKISTALVVLIFAVFLLTKIKLHILKKALLCVALVAGFSRAFWADYNYMGYTLFGDGEYQTVVSQYKDFDVSYIEGRIYGDEGEGGYSKKKYLSKCVNLAGTAVVDNVAEGSSGYNLTLRLIESRTEEVEIDRAYKLIIYGNGEEFHIGDIVSVNGEICDFVPNGNPGEFDRSSYYKARGIVGYGIGSTVTIEKQEENSNLWYSIKDGLHKLREKLSATLYSICDEDSASLYAGILLGDKGDIPDDNMLLFRMSGLAHIFAISGLHIGIVGGLLYKLLRKAGLKFLPASMVAVLITLLYGIMTGFSFSTIRAIVMLGLSLGGEVLGRKYDMLTGMGLALGILLMVEPFRILDGGLILSFGAVSGVVVSKYIVKLLEKNKKFKQLQRKKTRWLYQVVSGFIFSMGISLVTTPLISYMYFQFPLYSAVLNVLVVPLMTLTVFCGFFGVLLGTVNIFFGRMVIFPGVLSLKLYQWICKVFQMLPMDVINTGKPKVAELIIYYVMLAIVLIAINPDVISKLRKLIHNKTRKWVTYRRLRFYVICVMSLITLLGMVCIGLVRMSDAGEQIVFLDVGQGDGVLIHTESGTNMVIDVGSTSNNSLGEYVGYPGLLAEGMGHVDYWFVSHFDRDHTSGLEYVLSQKVDIGITIDNLVVSENVISLGDTSLIRLAKEKGINVIYMRQGDLITDGSFTVRALHPGDTFDSDDRNEQSLVLSYQSGNIKMLLTGDVGEEAIKSMLEQGVLDKDYHILKVPHHGSKYSVSMKFLERIDPEISIISCADRNSYGHPHKEMLEGLINVGSDIYRTDYMGAIKIIVN